MVTKNKLLGVLESHADNIRLVNIVRVLARKGNLNESFSVAIGEDGIKKDAFHKSLHLLANVDKLTHTTEELYKTVIRAAVTESFELSRDYCEKNNQQELFETQPWFQVFRLLRNALNHNFMFEFRKFDKTLLPCRWNSITIDISLDNKELSLNVLPVTAALEWLECLEEFITNELQ